MLLHEYHRVAATIPHPYINNAAITTGMTAANAYTTLC